MHKQTRRLAILMAGFVLAAMLCGGLLAHQHHCTGGTCLICGLLRWQGLLSRPLAAMLLFVTFSADPCPKPEAQRQNLTLVHMKTELLN